MFIKSLHVRRFIDMTKLIMFIGVILDNTMDTMQYIYVDYDLCDTVCKGIDKCVQSCRKPFRREFTSTLSTQHCGISTFDSVTGRILNSQIAPDHMFPWMVSLQINTSINSNKRYHFCGGAIINTRYILTAAHCPESLIPDYVMMASNSLSKSDHDAIFIEVEDIIKHEKWNRNALQNDIALIKTAKDIDFIVDGGKFIVNSICLPSTQLAPSYFANVTGWGLVSSEDSPVYLRYADLLYLDIHVCKTLFKESHIYMGWVGAYINWVFRKNPTLSNTQLCFLASLAPALADLDQSKNLNPGDSGSSILNYRLGRAHTIGIASFIATQEHNNPVSVTTKVSKYLEWIESKINRI